MEVPTKQYEEYSHIALFDKFENFENTLTFTKIIIDLYFRVKVIFISFYLSMQTLIINLTTSHFVVILALWTLIPSHVSNLCNIKL